MTVQELWEALDRLRLEGYASCDVVFSIGDEYSAWFPVRKVDMAYDSYNEAIGARPRVVELT